MKLRNTTNCDECCKGKRISELDEKVDIQGTEYIPYQEGDDNGKFSLGSLKDYLIKLIEEYLINNGIIREDWVQSEPAYKLLATLPELIADRACKDEFGNNINDTYLTRESVKEYIGSIFEDLFTENPPKILDGYITIDMLSDAVLQLLNSGGCITNFPDDEDLTVKDGKLKFKDKAYDPNNYSGFGRKYLRRNMVDGVNVLTQEMISEPNVIYVIQYDYDLRGETINIPNNCILDFEGGSLSNGVLNGSNTRIKANIEKIFNIDLKLLGTFNIDKGYIEWFINPNNGNDCAHAFEQFDKVGIPIKLLKNRYSVSRTIRLTNNPIIEGEKLWQSTIGPTSGATIDILLYISKEDGSAINSGYIKNINIEGYQYGTSTQGSKVGLLVSNATEMFTVSHIRLLHHRVGLYITKTWFCLFEAITSVYNTQYNYYINSADDLDLGINVGAINNVIFRNCASKGANIGTYIKGWNMAIAFDTCDWEYDTGEAEILMQENHASVTFLNCYWETDITLIKNINTYRNGKTIIIGGVFDDRGTDVIPLIIGKQSSFSLIGTYNEANNINKAYEYYITTEALYNSLIGAVPSGTKGCINPLADGSYVYADGIFNNYQQHFSNCTTNKVYAAPSIKAISKVVNDKCPAELRVGKTGVSQSSDGQTYQLRIAHRHPNDGITVQACVNSGGNETLIDLFDILNNQIRCVAPNGYTVQNFSTLPSSYLQHGRIGMYGDAVAGKNRYRPVILGNTKWRDSNGQPANLQPYGASLPDSTDLLPGFIFEDTINNRILYFNHDSSWIDLSTGTTPRKTSGTTEERPSSGGKIGFMYFDITLNKPIYWTGSKWVDATGADV